MKTVGAVLVVLLGTAFARDNHPLTLPNCHELMIDGIDYEVLNARDVDIIKGMIRDLIFVDETGCTDDRRAKFIASYVRLAWHDLATWDAESKTGGAHARMRFDHNPENGHNDPDNAGFENYIRYLDYIHGRFADRISRADLWVLAGLTAIEHGGGPPMRFRWGRTDEWDEDVGYSGRLPHAWKGDDHGNLDFPGLLDHLMDVMKRLDFTDDPERALVALLGAHNLGGPRPFQTGMVPGWLMEPIPWTPVGIYFHNAYYSELLWQQWWDSPAEDPSVHMTVHADNRTVMFYSDFAILGNERMVDLAYQYATNLNMWHSDFVKYFEVLLEVGYEEGELHDIHPAHLWQHGEWSMCSEICNGGVQTRTVWCMEYPSGAEVDSTLCENAPRYAGPLLEPVDTQPCNNVECSDFVWTYDAWSACTANCNSGTHTRDVVCMSLRDGSQGDAVPDKYCDHLTKPVGVEPCNTQSCGVWLTAPASQQECDMPCENSWIIPDFPIYRFLWTGEAEATFQCVIEYEGNPRVVDDSLCDDYEKPMYTKCVNRFCEQIVPHYRATQWSVCDAECDGGTQFREISCWGKPDDIAQHAVEFVKELEDGSIAADLTPCQSPPDYLMSNINWRYVHESSTGIALPPMPQQWAPEAPATRRLCNVRACKQNKLVDNF